MQKAILLLSVLVLISCHRVSEQGIGVRDLDEIVASDTLRVLTMYGPASYFLYRDNPMGYEYELSNLLCEELGVNLQMTIVPNEETMVKMIENGEADLIAYKLPYTNKNKERIAFSKKEYIIEQVLVQCKDNDMVTDVLDLCGKDVYVRKGTIYEGRLKNLNNEVGGGINIVHAPDSLTSEDLIASVATHKIELTVASNDMAEMSKAYFPHIDYSLDISFPQRTAWAVNKNAVGLLKYINKWNEKKKLQKTFAQIHDKYYKRSKYFEANGISSVKRMGLISPYDDIIKKYSKEIGWDWRLIAAVIYKESKFNPNTVSWAGACGLMQLMPNTAKTLGIENKDDIFDPEQNVKAGVKYLKKLEKIFLSVPNKNERLKLTLASYNSGPAHVLDARALARKYGKDPDIWEGNVAPYILLKSEPEYYTDSVCKAGYCRGKETIVYVDAVLEQWQKYMDRVSE